MELAGELRRLLQPGAVIEEPEQLRTYECDGLTGHRVVPSLVVLPETTEQVQVVVRACHAAGVPFVARGAGTGLSGGALPVADGVVICARAHEPDPRGRPRRARGSPCSPA